MGRIPISGILLLWASKCLILSALTVDLVDARTFDISRSDNIVSQWGGTQEEGRLAIYCDDTADAIAVGFLRMNSTASGLALPHFHQQPIPGSGCSSEVFPGSTLPNCPSFSDDIQACQAKGVSIFLSLDPGSGGSNDWYASEPLARAFANQIWDLFLGGSSDTRPFGDAVFDGVRVEIPHDPPDMRGFAALFDQLRLHTASAPKAYHLAAALWCPFPDSTTQPSFSLALNTAYLDAVYVAVFKDFCSVAHYDDKTQWNYGTWHNWATSHSANKDVKLFLSVLSRPESGNDYVNVTKFGQIAIDTRDQYAQTFGGVVYWDSHGARGNDEYNKALRNILLDDAPSLPPLPTSHSTTSSISASPTRSVGTESPEALAHVGGRISALAIVLGVTIPALALLVAAVVAVFFMRRRRQRYLKGTVEIENHLHVLPYREPARLAHNVESRAKRIPDAGKVSEPLSTSGQPSRSTISGQHQASDDLDALQSEMGRVGLSVPALLSSLSRLRHPPEHDALEVEGSVAPPRYE